MYSLSSIGSDMQAVGLGTAESPLTFCADSKIPIVWKQRLENWSQSIYATLKNNPEFHNTYDVNAYVAEILQEVMLLVRTFEFHANLVKPFSLTETHLGCIYAHVCSGVYDLHVEEGFPAFHIEPPIEFVSADLIVDYFRNVCEMRADNMKYLRFSTTHAATYFKHHMNEFLNETEI